MLRSNLPPINLFCGPPAHATKWTLVVDPPREARRLTLFDTQAEVHAEIIRLRERGVAHMFALAPVAACGDRPAVAAAVVGTPGPDSVPEDMGWVDLLVLAAASIVNERLTTVAAPPILCASRTVTGELELVGRH